MIRAVAAALSLFATSCATSDLPRPAREFERAWIAPVLGDEYARAGAYHPMTGRWGIVSLIHLPDRSWLVRRTESTLDSMTTTVARSETCEALASTIGALANLPPPSLREVDMNQAFFVIADGADARLRIHTYFEDERAAVSLTTMEVDGNIDSPIFQWYEDLLRGTETCWTQE